MSQELLRQYWPLVMAVKADHRRSEAQQGHDFLHPYNAAVYVERIVPDPEIRRLAWIGALIHNTDRIYGLHSEREAAAVSNLLLGYLDRTDLGGEERETVVTAVLRHHRRNSNDDSPVQQAIMDADRLANTGAAHLIRAGQFRPNIPPFDPRYPRGGDPKSDFRNPTSILEDLNGVLEWQDWLRLPLAIEIGKQTFGLTRAARDAIEREIREQGLDKLPAELLD